MTQKDCVGHQPETLGEGFIRDSLSLSLKLKLTHRHKDSVTKSFTVFQGLSKAVPSKFLLICSDLDVLILSYLSIIQLKI